MKTILLFLILSTLSFQSYGFSSIKTNKDNNTGKQSGVLADNSSLNSKSKDSIGLILNNSSKMKTDTIALGKLLKIETVNKEKFTGNLLSVNDSSLVLLQTNWLTIDTTIIPFESLSSIESLNKISKRAVGTGLIIFGSVLTPIALIGTMLTSAFNGTKAALLPASGSVVAFAFIPAGKSLVSKKKYRMEKWTPIVK